MASGMSSGIRRKVDDLGRVVIPAGIRRTLNIREGDTVEVSVDGERVVLAKPRDACVFCGREGDDLHRFRNRLLCAECMRTIGDTDRRSRADTSAAQPSPAPAQPSPARAPAQPPAHAPPPPSPAWPTGPIDGDAFAREAAQRRADEANRLARERPASDGDHRDDGPPAYDPASTTAW